MQNPNFSFDDPVEPINDVDFENVYLSFKTSNLETYKTKQVGLSQYSIVTDSTWTGNYYIESLINRDGIYAETLSSSVVET
jgi:hypothetical protein